MSAKCNEDKKDMYQQVSLLCKSCTNHNSNQELIWPWLLRTIRYHVFGSSIALLQLFSLISCIILITSFSAQDASETYWKYILAPIELDALAYMFPSSSVTLWSSVTQILRMQCLKCHISFNLRFVFISLVHLLFLHY